MTDDSRAERRRHVRERQKAGERGLARGLSANPTAAEIVAVAQALKAKLLEAANPRRAGEAAGLAHGLAERSLKAFPARAAIVCTKGCNYCCHGFVGVVPPEVFRIARALREATEPALAIEAVEARAKPLIGLSPDQRLGRKLACSLLVDGLCGVYHVRPLTCRQATSLSLPSCIEEFEGIDRDGRIEISSVHLAHASNAHVALLGAMKAARLPIEAYELSAALDVVLRDPDSERRWLAGEPVFATLATTVARQREIDLVAGRIAAELA